MLNSEDEFCKNFILLIIRKAVATKIEDPVVSYGI